MEFVIKGMLPTMNEIIDASKKHWSEYYRMKETYTRVVAYAIKDKRKLKRVNINITWYCPNKRMDKDNISGGGQKMILDGMVLAGVMENDGWNHVGDIMHQFEIDKENPRVYVMVEEVEE